MTQFHCPSIAVLLPSLFAFTCGLPAAEESGPPVIAVHTPKAFQVVQREGFVPARAHEHQPGGPELGFGMIPVCGALSRGVGLMEYRVVALENAFGKSTDWVALQGKFEGDLFRAAARVAAGGWYRLELRARSGDRVLGTASVSPVGVGEVFVIAGQSYASNANDERLKVEDPAGRVVAWSPEHGTWAIAHDPQPTPDHSDGGSIWPAFGNLLLPLCRVPIGLVNVAVGATSSRQWLPGDSLHKRLTTAGQAAGRFRAVLWQQGESDVIEGTTTAKYVSNLQAIRAAASEAWGFDPPWLLAKSTLHPTVYNNPDGEGRIRAGIDELCRLPRFRPGPDTDILAGPFRGDRQSRRHFTGSGQRAAALLWYAAVWRELNPAP